MASCTLLTLGCLIVTLQFSHFVHAHQTHKKTTDGKAQGGTQGGTGGHNHAAGGSTRPHGNMEIDQEHIKEHLEGVADITDDMTQEELEFHYFKLHDFDNNTKLDGQEIYKALTDLMPFEDVVPEESLNIPDNLPQEEVIIIKRDAAERYYSDIVDQVLAEDDVDDDGYLTYLEYALARRRAMIQEQHEARLAQQHQQYQQHQQQPQYKQQPQGQQAAVPKTNT